MKYSMALLLFVILSFSSAQAQVFSAFSPDPGPDPKLDCFGNQRIITGAIELWNMDHEEMIKSLSDKDVREGGKLVGNGYLSKPVTNGSPDCHYSSEGDLTVDGYVRCKAHGRVAEENEESAFQNFKTKAEKLLGAGADINAKNADGKTAVHVAIDMNNSMILEFLIAHKADLNIPDNDGKTPLRCAIDNHRLGISQLLLKNKALYDLDPNKLPPKENAPVFETSGNTSGLQIQAGDSWMPVQGSLSPEKPIRLKNVKSDLAGLRIFTPGVSGSRGAWGFEITIHHETEVEIPVLQGTDQLGSIAPLVFHLIRGEVSVNRSLSERKVIIQAGTVAVESQSGLQKVIYDPKTDSGEVICKNGLALVSTASPKSHSERISGFYKVSLKKGKIGPAEQASIIEYNWPANTGLPPMGDN